MSCGPAGGAFGLRLPFCWGAGLSLCLGDAGASTLVGSRVSPLGLSGVGESICSSLTSASTCSAAEGERGDSDVLRRSSIREDEDEGECDIGAVQPQVMVGTKRGPVINSQLGTNVASSVRTYKSRKLSKQ